MEKETFWKGVSAGFLAGMAVAAALRYSPFEKFITGLSTLDGKIDRGISNLEDKLNPVTVGQPLAGDIVSSAPGSFVLRREQTEDAVPFTSGLTNAGWSFDARGRGEERVDHIDLSQPLRRYPRSLDLGSAG